MPRPFGPLSSPLRASVRPFSLGSRPVSGPWMAVAGAGHEKHRLECALQAQPRLLLPMIGYTRQVSLASYSTQQPPSTRPPVKLPIDRTHEREVARGQLERHPDEVTADSSLPNANRATDEELPSVLETVAKDVNSIKEALDLAAVPREPYAIGLGGTIPYFATSLATVYLSWSLHHDYPTASPLANSFLLSHETAQQWLQVLEPIQLGYGAVILSFLGAIHWGMEYNEKTLSPERTRFRYGIGLLAPAIAWPSLLLPVHFALTAQFLAFTLLYFADSRATARGWAPPWYATYRFQLTFVVGAAILISLVYRAKADDAAGPGSDGATGASRRMGKRLQEGKHQGGQAEEEAYGDKWAALEEEERKKQRKEKAAKETEEKDGKEQGRAEGEVKGDGQDEEMSAKKADNKDDKKDNADKDDEEKDGKEEKKETAKDAKDAADGIK